MRFAFNFSSLSDPCESALPVPMERLEEQVEDVDGGRSRRDFVFALLPTLVVPGLAVGRLLMRHV